VSALGQVADDIVVELELEGAGQHVEPATLCHHGFYIITCDLFLRVNAVGLSVPERD